MPASRHGMAAGYECQPVQQSLLASTGVSDSNHTNGPTMLMTIPPRKVSNAAPCLRSSNCSTYALSLLYSNADTTGCVDQANYLPLISGAL